MGSGEETRAASAGHSAGGHWVDAAVSLAGTASRAGAFLHFTD